MQQQLQLLLDAWQAAEERRDGKPAGSAAWHSAEALVMREKEQYLAAVREAADRDGSAGMQEIAEGTPPRSRR